MVADPDLDAGMRSTGAPTRGTEQTILAMGARVRSLRTDRKLTLRNLAERTGISVSMLSMIERGVANASIGSLVAVAGALSVSLQDLFAADMPCGPSPVTRLERQAVFRMGTGTTRRVAHTDSETGVELAVNRYNPGGSSGSWSTHRDGLEFGVVISGHLTVEMDGTTHQLAPGDVIAYPSDRSHHIVNNGQTCAMAVWVNVREP